MAIIKRAVASAANEKSANGVVKINSIEEPKAKQKAEAAAADKSDAKKPAAKKASAAKKPAAKKSTATAEKKSTAAKPAEKKAEAPAKKATAKKAAETKKPAAKKAAPKAAAISASLTVQFDGVDTTRERIDEAFEGVWTHDMNRKISEVKSVNYYFKPQEHVVYFVTDDGTEGHFEI
ncbi:MAG: hypothetical protein J5966_10135 [Lachnospiraceae bacterium]|nr:hypothetical protein [Lachnospiraceae bacterium]